MEQSRNYLAIHGLFMVYCMAEKLGFTQTFPVRKTEVDSFPNRTGVHIL